MSLRRLSLGLLSMVLTSFAVAACGGGGGGTPTSPTTPPAGGPAATITITSSGASPDLVRIEVNQTVRFTNNSQRTIEIHSDPHPTSDLCPPLNEVGVLAPGQSHPTGSLTRARTCTFHDHANPDSGIKGTILVGVSEPTPAPPGGY